MIQHFHHLSNSCSRLTTERYSSSFSSAIRLLHKDIRKPVYNIYGMVRFADEIVDSFHGFNKKQLLNEFKAETYLALERKISLNPILNSFQMTVHKYDIDKDLVAFFFKSMESDLTCNSYDTMAYKDYIYGSAEVVGLMCLHVFCEGDKNIYGKLRPFAQALGAAFQKVNFLRDIKQDNKVLNRTYFPNVDFNNFTTANKQQIEKDIESDFINAYNGIRLLPVKARFGVYVAYKYYLSLFKKIQRTRPAFILEDRVRIPGYSKAFIVVRAGIRSQLNIL